MTSSDISVLEAMGYDPEMARLAVQKSGNLNSALDWLEKNKDRPIETLRGEGQTTEPINLAGQDEVASSAEPSSPSGRAEETEGQNVAKSYRCNECGKQLNSVAQMNYHASKTQHTDFDESTEEVAPVSKEEAQKRLEELKAKLKAKQEAEAKLDMDNVRMNEQIRRKATQESQEAKERAQKLAALKKVEDAKRAKQEDEAHRKKVLAEIEETRRQRAREREMREAARKGTAPPAEEPAPKPAAVPAPPSQAASSDEIRVQLRMPSGTPLIVKVGKTTTFGELAERVRVEREFVVDRFEKVMSPLKYGSEDFGVTLAEAGLAGSASFFVR